MLELDFQTPNYSTPSHLRWIGHKPIKGFHLGRMRGVLKYDSLLFLSIFWEKSVDCNHWREENHTWMIIQICTYSSQCVWFHPIPTMFRDLPSNFIHWKTWKFAQSSISHYLNHELTIHRHMKNDCMWYFPPRSWWEWEHMSHVTR